VSTARWACRRAWVCKQESFTSSSSAILRDRYRPTHTMLAGTPSVRRKCSASVPTTPISTLEASSIAETKSMLPSANESHRSAIASIACGLNATSTSYSARRISASSSSLYSLSGVTLEAGHQIGRPPARRIGPASEAASARGEQSRIRRSDSGSAESRRGDCRRAVHTAARASAIYTYVIVDAGGGGDGTPCRERRCLCGSLSKTRRCPLGEVASPVVASRQTS
jgi:hypothetical protein